MNKLVPMIVGGIVLVGLIALFVINQSKHYNWSQNYETEGKGPYDMMVLYKMLEEKFELKSFKERLIAELPKEKDSKGTTYLYVGQSSQYTEDEAWHLRRYVEAGGEAFIVTENIQESLAGLLFYPEDCGSSAWQGQNKVVQEHKVFADFSHPSISGAFYEFEYLNEYKATAYYWSFIPDNIFCNSQERVNPIASLGTFIDKEEKNSYNNFIRVKVGEGHFYFHTNPIMFTNLFMVNEAGFEYANYVFSHIQTQKVFWDRESLFLPPKVAGEKKVRPTTPVKSPLDYIFSQKSLRWSWYLAIALGLVYVLFGGKRRQRKIPILEINRNTSLEFVETIGQLHFQTKDDKGMIKKQMYLFLAHIRQRYNLVTKDIDDKLITRIAVRSKVDEQVVANIFKEYARLEGRLGNKNGVLPTGTLNNFYLLIEEFHAEVRKMQFVK